MSYNTKQNQEKGIVKGILSGNSLIINFISPDRDPYMIINLESLISPRLGTPDGKIQDEPHAYESWDYIRNLCIGKKVLVGPVIREIQDRNSSSPLKISTPFGFVKVAHSRVSVFNNNTFEDVGLNVCRAGMVKIRESNPNFAIKPGSYLSKLHDSQEEAQSNNRGIWSEEEGFIRNLPVPYKDYQILETREFEATVDGIINATSLQLFLLPNHQYILLQIAGCRADLVNKRNPDKNSIGYKAFQEVLKRFLHKKILVRLCQKIVNIQDTENEGPRKFVGCVIGEPDLTFQKLISEGLARYDPKTSDYAPNSNEYIVREIVARAKKLGMWENLSEEELNVNRLPTGYPQEVQGIVSRVHSSSSLEITDENRKYIFYLNNVKAPYFFYFKSGGSEPCGYEAREFLRKHYVGQRVRAVIDGCYNSNINNPSNTLGVRVYATIYHEKKCVNEELVRSGFAQYHDSYIDRSSPRSAQIRQADNESREKKNGIHSTTTYENIVIDDLANYSNQRRAQEVFNQIHEKKLEGVIEHITTGGKFFVYVPSQGIYIKCGVNGVISYSSTDRMSSEVYKYTSSHFSQATVEVTPIIYKFECFYSTINIQNFYGKRFDLAEELLKNGLAEINKQYLNVIPSNYFSLQNSAETAGIGVWSISTRHNYRLKYGVVEKVKVTSIWNPITLTIQLLDRSMEHINEVLNNSSNDLVRIENNDKVSETLSTNDCIVCKYNNKYYRARIDTFVTQQISNGQIKINGIKDVFFIDFCEPKKDCFNNPIYEFFYLPEELKNIESQACVIKLAFLENALDSEDEINKAVEAMFEMCTEFILYAHLVYDDEGANVFLTDGESRDSGTLNSVVLQKKYARFVDHEVRPEFEKAKQQLSLYQQPETKQEDNEENENKSNEPTDK